MIKSLGAWETSSADFFDYLNGLSPLTLGRYLRGWGYISVQVGWGQHGAHSICFTQDTPVLIGSRAAISLAREHKVHSAEGSVYTLLKKLCLHASFFLHMRSFTLYMFCSMLVPRFYLHIRITWLKYAQFMRIRIWRHILISDLRTINEPRFYCRPRVVEASCTDAGFVTMTRRVTHSGETMSRRCVLLLSVLRHLTFL